MNPTIVLVAPDRPDQIQALANMKRSCEEESGYDPFVSGDGQYWMVYDMNKMIGFTGIHSVDWRARVCRGSGIYVLPEYRKHGYGTVVLKERNLLCFNQLNLRKMEACIDENNKQMLSIVEKQGGVKEGRWIDRSYYNGKYHTYIQWVWFKKEG